MQINCVHLFLYSRRVIDAVKMSVPQLCAPSAHSDVMYGVTFTNKSHGERQ